MASSLLMLLDDIATALDDIAAMTKVAAKKTAGLVGDDLAVNANQIHGITAQRELGVVWAVTKGSILNKIILIPIAILLSYFLPWIIKPLLIGGGAFLCFEAFEKISHKFFHKKENEENKEAVLNAIHANQNMLEFEKEKIKSAIKTDFILSAEIMIIALGTVSDKGILNQLGVLSLIGLGMTCFVYGLVALIVKADDFGLLLQQSKNSIKEKIGSMLISIMPKFMKFLGFLGTFAMFSVGGGILVHSVSQLQYVGLWFSSFSMLFDIIIGMILGAICVAFFEAFHHFKKKLYQNLN